MMPLKNDWLPLPHLILSFKKTPSSSGESFSFSPPLWLWRFADGYVYHASLCPLFFCQMNTKSSISFQKSWHPKERIEILMIRRGGEWGTWVQPHWTRPQPKFSSPSPSFSPSCRFLPLFPSIYLILIFSFFTITCVDVWLYCVLYYFWWYILFSTIFMNYLHLPFSSFHLLFSWLYCLLLTHVSCHHEMWCDFNLLLQMKREEVDFLFSETIMIIMMMMKRLVEIIVGPRG